MRGPFNALLLLALAALSTDAHATVMQRLDVRELAWTAPVIVEGRVVAQRTLLMQGRPWTESEIQVLESHKGALRRGAVVQVRQPGGIHGRIGMRVAGAAQFKRSERVLVFLRPVDGYNVPVGMGQGKFEIYTDRAGMRRGRRDLSGISFAQLTLQGRVELTRELRPVDQDQPLTELISTIQAAVQATKRAPSLPSSTQSQGGAK